MEYRDFISKQEALIEEAKNIINELSKYCKDTKDKKLNKNIQKTLSILKEKVKLLDSMNPDNFKEKKASLEALDERIYKWILWLAKIDKKLKENTIIEQYLKNFTFTLEAKKLQKSIYKIKNLFIKHPALFTTLFTLLFNIFGFLILGKYYWSIAYTPTSNIETLLPYAFVAAIIGLLFIFLITFFIYGAPALSAIQLNKTIKQQDSRVIYHFAYFTASIYIAFLVVILIDSYCDININEHLIIIFMFAAISILSLYFSFKFATNNRLKTFAWLLTFEATFAIPFTFTLQLIDIENIPLARLATYIIIIAPYAWLYIALIMKFATSPYRIFSAITLASLVLTCWVFPDQIVKNSHIGNYNPEMLYIDKQMQEVFIANGVKKEDIHPIDDNIIGVSNIKVLSNIGAQYYLETNGERFLIDSSFIKGEHIESQATKKQNTNP